jgi:Family of unknown function (DUF5522)
MNSPEQQIAPVGETPMEPERTVLVEVRDFYIENGFYVFTAEFLRRRGYCCGNGCRHCPYETTAK